MKQRVMKTAVWRDWSCTVRVVTDAGVNDRAAEDVRALMGAVEDAASRFRADTELSLCNRRAGLMTPVSGLFVELTSTAIAAASFTDGAVDPTIGAHLVALGYNADIATIQRSVRPSHAGRSSPTRLPDWTAVRIDPLLALVGLPPGLALDLGATAKAWTADRAAGDLHQRYGSRVLVEMGGDIAVAGAVDEPFVIKVAEREGGTGTFVELRHGGLATSTTSIRHWRDADRSRHHIIDPSTGLPATGHWRTATIWANTAVRANAAATAAIVMNDRTISWLSEHAPVARLVDVDGFVRYLGGWPSTSQAAA